MSSKHSPSVFITGGTGFIGRHLLEALKEKGCAVRCLVRNSADAAACHGKGFETWAGNILDRESLKGSLDGITMVVHLAGIIEEKADMTFEMVHVEGTKNLVDEAKQAGAKHFFYQSALGASRNSPFRYQRTKAEAEEIVKDSGIPYTIFRPSLVIGEEDDFTEKLKRLIRLSPVVAVPGDGNARFQPIDVDDWVTCFLTIIGNENALGKTYEFGGPEHLTYNEIVMLLMEVMGTKKTIVHMPTIFARAGVPFISVAKGLGRFLGKDIPSVTSEQIRFLGMDNICELDSVEKLFGFKPITCRESLWKFTRA